MPPGQDPVQDAPFADVPRGSSADTFDDKLNQLDGTDPAENLSLVPKKDDGFPSEKELQSDPNATEDGPVPPETDADDKDPGKDKKPEGTETDKPPETTTEEGEYTEADRLKELGHNYESIEAFTDAQTESRKAEADALKQEFARRGITLYGNTPGEIAQELSYLGRGLPAADPEAKTQTQTTKTSESDDKSRTMEDLLDQYLPEDADKNTVKFYRRFASVTAAPLQAKITEMEKQLASVNSMQAEQDYVLDQVWYAQAAAAMKGDGPIPSFTEIRRMVQADPNGRASALYRSMTFGSEKDNPFVSAIERWRTQTNAVGITNADVAKKRETAKVARFKRQSGGGKATDRLKTPKANEAADIAAMRKLPVSVLE